MAPGFGFVGVASERRHTPCISSSLDAATESKNKSEPGTDFGTVVLVVGERTRRSPPAAPARRVLCLRSARNEETRRDRIDGRPRRALQAPRLHLPGQRDLRRHQRLLGLRPARRRAQEQPARRVVARHGALPAARSRRPAAEHRRRRHRHHPAPEGLGGVAATSAASTTRWSTAARPRRATATTT